PSSSSRRVRDEDINPTLCTPTKRRRFLHNALSSTSSGSFLVSSSPYKANTAILDPILELPPSRIPQPNWSLAQTPKKGWRSRETLEHDNTLLREALEQSRSQVNAQGVVIERTHAQLVYQNMHLRHQNFALNAKENQKKADRTQLFDGEGQIFSSDNFIHKIDAIAAAKQATAAEKSQRANERRSRKAANEELEREWTRIKEQHELDVKAWEDECDVYANNDIPKREWPKKPVRPLKPKLS
ncbi:hypothetical protein CPB83DRAFT_733632, partial [Crepidotus variabilis]